MMVSEYGSDLSKGLWSLIGFVFVLCAGVWAVTGIGVTGPQFAGLCGVVAVLLGISFFYTVSRPDRRIARLSRGMVELILIVFMVGVLSYNGASLNRPLWDDTFFAWDQALGFDWAAWLHLLDAHSGIHRVLVVAYHSMLPQTIVAVLALVSARAYTHLNIYLLAYGLAALVTVAIAAAMPALGPIVQLGITPADHPNIVLALPVEVQEQAIALREGRMHVIDLGGAQGLVNFPSFHTVSAVILLVAFSAVPYLRWASFALNAVMLVAIPIEGGHYLVDVLAGAALALACWTLAAVIVRRETSRPARSPFRAASAAS